MTDFTSRMVRLMEAVRRERNGEVAATMRCYGTACGLNFGVSLPTLRAIARAERPDHDFARYPYLQDVRELRLAALHIARPERVAEEEFAAWAAGIVNSEIAEEAAFALLGRIACFDALYEQWTSGDDMLLQYAALMAAARRKPPQEAHVRRALELLGRNAGPMDRPAPHLTAHGTVALLVAYGALNAENRRTVLRATGSPGTSPAEDYVHEEVAWMLEA